MSHRTAIRIAIFVVIALAAPTTVLAQQTGGLAALADRVETLEGQVAALQSQLTAVRSRLDGVRTRPTSVSIAARSFAFVDASCAAGEQVLGGGHASFVALSSAIAFLTQQMHGRSSDAAYSLPKFCQRR